MAGRRCSLFSYVVFVALVWVHALSSSCCTSSTILTTTTTLVDDVDNDLNFLQCLTFNSMHYSDHDGNKLIPVFTPNTTSYSSILLSSIQNLIFTSSSTPKPRFIVAPTQDSHVQVAVICSKKHGLQIRVRSGGHDFEGLSYTSSVPFVLIDLFNLRAIDVNIEDNNALVQAGATLGEVYYSIAEKSHVHGFPSGQGRTIGVGGHFSVAGFGPMLRKYGTAADQISDARLVNANGEVLNREAMGEDLFWAIRGGGASSFGVVLAWKINLVAVPPIVTVASIDKAYEQGATELVHKWKTVASRQVPQELYIELIVGVSNNTSRLAGRRAIELKFKVMFLGLSKKLMQLMEDMFPELGIKANECNEMSWIESVVYFARFRDGIERPTDWLLSRDAGDDAAKFKVKSDFVTEPISKTRLEEIWRKILEENEPYLAMSPWGGRMSEIPEGEIAFPHRAKNLYMIGYLTYWDEAQERHFNWIRELYEYMTPYVSKSPRAHFSPIGI
ncbi:hypothetical protein Syun_025100 [Stephania yunnanensis]|uniref:FAD-binding PCMH-type domain-containing protein n=1 Tax=Stephania yunnanensis TaxID=152371 RepID=A0AAP0HVX4_9MAGN